jgi:rhodanese-related sulfurtransferase
MYPATIAEPEKLAATRPAVIGTEALGVLVRAGVPMVILDARGGQGDARVRGAHVVPAKPDEKTVAALVPNKDALIVTYCGGPKCPLSVNLAAHLRGFGYRNVLEYREGIEGWVAAGLPVEGSRTAEVADGDA